MQCRLLGLDQLGFRFDEEVSEEGSLAVYVRIQVSVYESLRYHKYLIVLDDIWNTQIVIKGSRIILTSRLLDLIIPPPGRISNQIIPFTANEFCHPQVEKIGRKIANKTAENEDPLIINSDDNTPLFPKVLF